MSIKINEVEDAQGFVDAFELCNETEPQVSRRVDEKSCRNEIDTLKERSFSGVIKLISGFEELLSTEIIVLDSGKIKFFSIEEGGDNREIEKEVYGAGDGKVLLEIYERPDTQARISEAEPYSVSEIERIIEAYMVIKKYGTSKPDRAS